MQIDRGFQSRVEVLAHRHANDWRIQRNLSAQDYWLIAQAQVRKMGARLYRRSAIEFTEHVRRQADQLHNTRPHACHGPLRDWDMAWLQELYGGYHLTEATPWLDRSHRHCAVVYFVQEAGARQDLGSLVYSLQIAYRSYEANLRKLLFRAVGSRNVDLLRVLRETSVDYPTVFVVNAELLQTCRRLPDVLDEMSSLGVPWRCDSDFISRSLRDIQPYGDCPLNWNWANYSGYGGTPTIAYDLAADMLAL